MKFSEIVDQASALIQRKGRVTYRALKLEFSLDEEQLDALKEELLFAHPEISDADGRGLAWTGDQESVVGPTSQAVEPTSPRPFAEPQTPVAERRQLTVMFCDLVGSTALSEQLDPEDLREVVQTYQQTSATVIERYEGYIAQYLGDGLLVYFGYPQAHEDDAFRAVRVGLEIITALHQAHSQFPQPVQARIGIHTGQVVVGEMGGGRRHEQLALGDTPNIAARVQGKAEPDSVVISPATYRLVHGLFTCQDLGLHELKGISTAQSLYRVQDAREEQSRFEVAVRTGLTPFVGRAAEVSMLRQAWQQARDGVGQVVLLSGEPGIGKSRLVQELKDDIASQGATRIEFRCSAYHQNSALYPVTGHLRRVLGFGPTDSEQKKVEKLEAILARYRFPQAETGPLLAALLSLAHPGAAVLSRIDAERQKQQTREALVAWLMEEAEKQPVYCTWEDLHWADPSTLDFVGRCLEQVPTVRMLALLVFRPEFSPPWESRVWSKLRLRRLGSLETEGLIGRVTGGRALPAVVLEQIVEKTDGVPLFVEELTKMIVESSFVRTVNGRYELTGPVSALAIPSTLHDSLMARLDRLGPAKSVAQLGATLGREFSYELLQAVSAVDEESLQNGLARLVDTELIYQRGLPPQANYIFKHALVQDTAYQSLLKRERQRLHRQSAQVLEAQFPETLNTQPELVAHHYTEAGLGTQALPYWLTAGEQAVERSANAEAIGHLTKGVEVLATLSDAAERPNQELSLQIALGVAFMATKGYAAQEVGRAFTRARELCRQVGEKPQLAQVLYGLWAFHLVHGELLTAYEEAEQLLRLGQNTREPELIIQGHHGLGQISYFMGEFASAREYCEQGIALYDSQQRAPNIIRLVQDPGVLCRGYAAWSLWQLGYPDQALDRLREALTLAQELAHPFTSALLQIFAMTLYQWCGQGQLAQERTEELIALSTEHEFPELFAIGMARRAGVLIAQGQVEEGLIQLHQSADDVLDSGNEFSRPATYAGLATAYLAVGRIDEGLALVTKALTLGDRTGRRLDEAGLYLLKGTLFLRSGDQKIEQVEESFQTAITIARRQQAKSLELRAATSLARLWQQQGKKAEAHQLLSGVYNWFTEGFDTADLKDAKALLDQLAL